MVTICVHVARFPQCPLSMKTMTAEQIKVWRRIRLVQHNLMGEVYRYANRQLAYRTYRSIKAAH